VWSRSGDEQHDALSTGGGTQHGELDIDVGKASERGAAADGAPGNEAPRLSCDVALDRPEPSEGSDPLSPFLGRTIYVLGLLIAEGLRLPKRMASRRASRAPRTSRRLALREIPALLSLALFVWLFPLVRVFTPWLSALDYQLAAWSTWAGAALFALAIVVRVAGQGALGSAWSAAGDGVSGEHLVTDGIYRWIRHPLYASMILWALAQPLLLGNWLAGVGGLLAPLCVWGLRVPLEERLLSERFGEDYWRWERDTGALLPRPRCAVRQADRADTAPRAR
jgi:protein-S-isoprenylcysteine O-methyltransferase Ste14